jgi:hypothetical protein
MNRLKVAVPILVVLALGSTSLTAQENGASAPPRNVQGPQVNAQELVKKAVANEIRSAHDDVAMMFRVRRVSPRRLETRQYIETGEGTAGMLVAVNDKPLGPNERQQELDRLQKLLQNPSELRKKQKQQKEDSDRVLRMVSALPDAFHYEYDGKQVLDGEELVRLKFRPNPDFDPPSRELQVFTGMSGFLLLAQQPARIARIDGTLFKDVGFGWGILGHLDRGGRFVVVQRPVAEGYWATTHMQLSFTGKALFFKAINIQTTEDSSGFRRVPSHLSFAQGVEMLKHDGELAENRRASGRGRTAQ